MTTNRQSTEITALLGNFLSKYDETATTGLERLCIVLDQEQQKSKAASAVAAAAAASTNSAAAEQSFASVFVHNEQVCDTFVRLQQRAKIDVGLYWNAVCALIQGCDRRDRVYCIHRLCGTGPQLFTRLRRVLAGFEPESQQDAQRGTQQQPHQRKGAIAVEHVERALQLATIILKYNPRLLASRLGSSATAPTSSSLSSGGGAGGAAAAAASSKLLQQQQQHSQQQQHQFAAASSWTLPIDFPLFSAVWFPSWCQRVRALRAEYLLAALAHPLRDISLASVTQPRVLTCAFLDPTGLASAAVPGGRALLCSLLQNFVASFVTAADIPAAQKCDTVRAQRNLPKQLASCLELSSASSTSDEEDGAVVALAQTALRAMVDNIAEPSSNYSSNATAYLVDDAPLAALRQQQHQQQQQGAATETRMPNFWMLVLLRSLSPGRRAADTNLTCYVLSRYPELYRPYIARVSSHLMDKKASSSFGSSGSTATARVATCNALSRVLTTPLAFHLTSPSVANIVLPSSSSSGGGGAAASAAASAATTFYDLTPQAAVDEVCPMFLQEFCHKIIQDAEQPVLEFLFCMQVVRAALQRAAAVRTALQRIFDFKETATAVRQQQQQQQHLQRQHEDDAFADAAEWAAEASFFAEFDRLLAARLPQITTIVSRLQNQIVPRLAAAGSVPTHDGGESAPAAESTAKFQFLAQRTYAVLHAYLTAFDRPISVVASLPPAFSSSTQVSTVAAVVDAIRVSYDARVEHLPRLHHVDANADAQQPLPLFGSILVWVARALAAAASAGSSNSSSGAIAHLVSATEDALVKVVQSVIVDTGSAYHRQLALEAHAWLRHFAASNVGGDDEADVVTAVVRPFLQMLTTLLAQSKSKQADSISERLFDCAGGALVATARSFVTRALEKAEKNNNSNAKRSLQKFSNFVDGVERDLTPQIAQLHGGGEEEGDATAAAMESQNQPAVLLNAWSKECSLGVATIAAGRADATVAAPVSPLDAFLMLLDGSLSEKLPVPSRALCGDRSFVDIAALRRIASAKSFRKGLVAEMSWAEDAYSVWHVLGLLLPHLAAELMQPRPHPQQQQQQQQQPVKASSTWAFAARALFESWQFPASILEQQQSTQTAHGELLVGGTAALMLVCAQCAVRQADSMTLAELAPFATRVRDTLLPLYGGSRSFSDRILFSLLTVTEELASAAVDSSPQAQLDEDAEQQQQQQQQQSCGAFGSLLASRRFILGVGPASAADASSRFPELQVLHAIFESHTETQCIADALATPLELHTTSVADVRSVLGASASATATSSSSTSSSSMAALSLWLLRCVYSEAAHRTWWTAVARESTTSHLQCAMKVLTAKAAASGGGGGAQQQQQDASSGSASSLSGCGYDLRFLIPLIHTIVSVRARRLIDVPNYFSARALPYLVRGTSLADDKLRQTAFDALALCYNALHPTRRLIVDSIRVAIAAACASSSSPSTTAPLPRIPSYVTAALIQSVPIVARPQQSLFESVCNVLCEIPRSNVVASSSSSSSSSTPSALIPFRDALAAVSPDSLIPSGAPFVDSVVVPRSAVPNAPSSNSANSGGGGGGNKKNKKNKNKGGGGAPLSTHLIAPLTRTGLARELAFLLATLGGSCATESDFVALHDAGVLSQLLALFHTTTDFPFAARAILGCITAVMVGPGAATPAKNGLVRVLFAQHFFQWIASTLSLVVASSSETSASSSSGDAAASIALSLSPRNASELCNALVDALRLCANVLCSVPAWNRAHATNVAVAAVQIAEWATAIGSSGAVGSSRLSKVMVDVLLPIERRAGGSLLRGCLESTVAASLRKLIGALSTSAASVDRSRALEELQHYIPLSTSASAAA